MTTLNTTKIKLPVHRYFVFTHKPTAITHMGVRLITSILAVTVSIVHVGVGNCPVVGMALEEIIAIHQLRYKCDS